MPRSRNFWQLSSHQRLSPFIFTQSIPCFWQISKYHRPAFSSLIIWYLKSNQTRSIKIDRFVDLYIDMTHIMYECAYSMCWAKRVKQKQRKNMNWNAESNVNLFDHFMKLLAFILLKISCRVVWSIWVQRREPYHVYSDCTGLS